MFDSMMGVLLAFWHQDFSALMAPGSAGIIYIVVATLIFWKVVLFLLRHFRAIV